MNWASPQKLEGAGDQIGFSGSPGIGKLGCDLLETDLQLRKAEKFSGSCVHYRQ
jgi:hypothetical protein